MSVKDELFKARDNILSSIRSFLTTYAIVEDTGRFKEFVKYINRYTASEVQFHIEEHGFKHRIEEIIDEIGEVKFSNTLEPTKIKEEIK